MKNTKKHENARMMCVCGGGGSLKASLARVFSRAKFKGCLVGLKAQHAVDSHMLSLREGQSPTKQSIDLTGLPRSRWSLAMTKNSITNLSPYRPSALTPLAKAAFTMAEILLSLTIIGVVAAITLPSLTGNINERTWNTQRKALHARVSQAVSLLDGMRGYGDITNVSEPNFDNGWATVYSSTNATDAFLSAGLSKVLKLNNICDYQHLSDCGLSSEMINMAGSKIGLATMDDLYDLNGTFSTAGSGRSVIFYNKNAAFETQNGESMLTFYNPYCKDFKTASSSERTQGGGYQGHLSAENVMCLNFVYDLNGKKGPNTVGKDVGFMSVFYPADPIVVAPVPQAKNAGQTTPANANNLCRQQGDEYRVPNLEELMSIHINNKLLDVDFASKGPVYTSSTRADVWNGAYQLSYTYGSSFAYWGDINLSVRCIKR